MRLACRYAILGRVRIAYCTNVRLPSERAHGHQVAQVCDALIRLGHTVSVYCPFRRAAINTGFSQYFGVDPRISLVVLGSFDPIAAWWLPGVLGLWVLNWQLRQRLSLELSVRAYDLLYTRSPAILAALLHTGLPVILELHQLPRFGRRSFVRRCNACRRVTCLTSVMRDQLIRWGVAPERVTVAADAVDLRRFADLPIQGQARQHFGLLTQRPVVGYVGRLKTLGQEKGVGDLLRALAISRSRDWYVWVVGGPANDVADYRVLARTLGLTDEDVSFTGEIVASDVPSALAACDALAMPFPDRPHYRQNMSPLKMFEYMAAGKPIITTDLPTIRDVLSEETAVFCRPGDPADLDRAIRWVFDHSNEAKMRAARAQELVHEHTWETRMTRVLQGITT